MKKALEGFGRRPELTERDLDMLKRLIAAGELESAEAVQSWISEIVLQLEGEELISIAKARALYRKALGIRRRRPEYAISAEFIKELKRSRPNVATALSLIVKNRISVRRAAYERCDESTLRYYLRKAAEKKEPNYLSQAFLSRFYDWCDRQKKVTVERTRHYLVRRNIKNKSNRSIHRYIQGWKDARGIKRRHWTCGGSKWS